MNITEAIWQNCKANPVKEAIVSDGRIVTYKNLYELSLAVTNKLLVFGVKKGDVVANRLENPIAFIASVLAIARIGAIGMPFNNKWSDEETVELLQKNSAKFLINPLNIQAYENKKLLSLKNIHAEELFLNSYTQDDLNVPNFIDEMDDKPWWIGLTSGTTGAPKSIYKTHAKMLLSCAVYPELHNADYERVFVSLDLKISFGLGTVIRTLLSSKTVVATQNPMADNFFAIMQRDKPTNVTTSVAIIALIVKYAKTNLVDKELLSSLKRVTIGGAKVSQNIRADIQHYLCDQLEVRYSSTESGPIAVATNETYKLYPTSSGKIVPWVKYQIVDENHELLNLEQTGMLRFQTPIMTDKYINDKTASQKHFKDGWFYTGDIGTIDQKGFLYISGRADHLINIGGVKTHPEAIEIILSSHEDVIESAVLQLEHPIDKSMVLVAVIVAEKIVDEKELRVLCNIKLNAMLVPQFFVMLNELPKNPSGKLMRNQLAKMLQINNFEKK
ncbi:acyl--CoA ligase [bacterium]|nr:acyl--CoA ligase [bacterium]MBU1435224.1 acyl--CoA ligase [bacterium]MBU1502921.1 acyl--CoA ligase [bacterium]